MLAQSNSPRARQVLTAAAKGASNPDCSAKRSSTSACTARPENRAILADIYASSSDVDIKRQILRSFMVAGDKTRMLKVAATEKNPELRQEAVRQLGVMGAHEELWQLYQKESSAEVKSQMMRAMFVGGDADALIDVAQDREEPGARGRSDAAPRD